MEQALATSLSYATLRRAYDALFDAADFAAFQTLLDEIMQVQE